MQKINLDLLGSCVLRDAIEFSEAAREKIKVQYFFQNNSAISLGSDKLSQVMPVNITENDFKDTAPVWYRWFKANAEETVYDTLEKSESNILFISLDECYYGYYIFENEQFQARICPSMAINKNSILKKINYNYKSIDTLKYPDIDKLVENHCRRIRQIYSPENIILLEFYPARHYIENGCLYSFADPASHERIESLLDKVYGIFHAIIPEARIIKLPQNVIGDPNHKWGNGSRHFIPEVYAHIADSLLELIGASDTRATSYGQLAAKLEKLIALAD